MTRSYIISNSILANWTNLYGLMDRAAAESPAAKEHRRTSFRAALFESYAGACQVCNGSSVTRAWIIDLINTLPFMQDPTLLPSFLKSPNPAASDSISLRQSFSMFAILATEAAKRGHHISFDQFRVPASTWRVKLTVAGREFVGDGQKLGDVRNQLAGIALNALGWKQIQQWCRRR